MDRQTCSTCTWYDEEFCVYEPAPIVKWLVGQTQMLTGEFISGKFRKPGGSWCSAWQAMPSEIAPSNSDELGQSDGAPEDVGDFPSKSGA